MIYDTKYEDLVKQANGTDILPRYGQRSLMAEWPNGEVA